MRLLPVKAKVNSSLRLEALTELSRILKWLLKKENKRKKSIKDQAKVVLKIGSIIPYTKKATITPIKPKFI